MGTTEMRRLLRSHPALVVLTAAGVIAETLTLIARHL